MQWPRPQSTNLNTTHMVTFDCQKHTGGRHNRKFHQQHMKTVWHISWKTGTQQSFRCCCVQLLSDQEDVMNFRREYQHDHTACRRGLGCAISHPTTRLFQSQNLQGGRNDSRREYQHEHTARVRFLEYTTPYPTNRLFSSKKFREGRYALTTALVSS
jgi:hypothetical protein